MGMTDHQRLALRLRDRVVHWPPAGLHRRRDLLLHDPLSGLQLVGQNRVAQLRNHVIAECAARRDGKTKNR